jgi:hypothetical protein
VVAETEQGHAAAEFSDIGLLHPVHDQSWRRTSAPDRSRASESVRGGFQCDHGPCSHPG